MVILDSDRSVDFLDGRRQAEKGRANRLFGQFFRKLHENEESLVFQCRMVFYSFLQRFAKLLYEAAKDGHVDAYDVYEVLDVKRDAALAFVDPTAAASVTQHTPSSVNGTCVAATAAPSSGNISHESSLYNFDIYSEVILSVIL